LLKERIETVLSTLSEHDTEYRAYLEASLADISACHAGYFSQDNSDSDEDIAKEVETILHGKKHLACGNLLADTEKMDDNRGEPSGGVDMAMHFDRDTKIAYVEQIESGKLTVTEAVRELAAPDQRSIHG